MIDNLEGSALALIAGGKGILAADETVPTLTRRFDALGLKSTEQSRRAYREMLVGASNIAEFIGGVILHDETIRQSSSDGIRFPEFLANRGILPGIKVDRGAKPLAGSPNELVTEGLDGLRDRLSEYQAMGARLAKWRTVIHISDTIPSPACVSANANALATKRRRACLVPPCPPQCRGQRRQVHGRDAIRLFMHRRSNSSPRLE